MNRIIARAAGTMAVACSILSVGICLVWLTLVFAMMLLAGWDSTQPVAMESLHILFITNLVTVGLSIVSLLVQSHLNRIQKKEGDL